MAFEFQVILYTTLLILLIVLIALCVKMIHTLNKIDKVVDDVNIKLNKVEGLFNIMDTTTNAIASLNDKVVSGIYGIFHRIFRKKEDE